MLILALDTTTRAGSCALWRDGVVLEERAGRADITHAQRLPGDLADLLDAHGLRVAAIDLFAVASGPGSFTGMRVGIATLQALALVHGRPIVPVTALEALGQYGARLATAAAAATASAATIAATALATTTPASGTAEAEASATAATTATAAGADASISAVTAATNTTAAAAGSGSGAIVGAWMEAYRGEVFGALYRVGDPRGALFQLHEFSDDAVAAPDALADLWAAQLALPNAGQPGAGQSDSGQSGSAASSLAPRIIIGDGVPASEERLRARWPGARLVPEVPLAGVIAEIAAAAPERGVHPHAIVPVYIRRSDAELTRERKLAADLPAAPASSR